ncbi:6-phosphogluconate dehydrogenase family protein [Cordyceps fumosorosea ARSEF 2679]|uniref:6-phosphogluconate dehydrogenase family protein n=1 Tax=Cordyceps fumosorosea (strain ARSEF 2679) TaxID=1081104 RepID=A0A167XGS4_CORFA|nr:6-phosphogluconate dehydrogenase family protein [Cordyceps fumosorosea ARSEF 2679]OAA64964.1 6-phosphogluconate dehydrogenase family protein [Cordyceps fumosorosea ARSEF 2679]
MPRIAWIGLGSIGEAISTNLAQYAPLAEPVLVWNRTAEKAERVAAATDRMEAARSLADAVSRADIVCLCLADDAAVSGVVDVVGEVDVSGKLFVDLSTVHPDTNQAQADRLQSLGAAYIACPIFGGVAMAIERQITLVLAGPSDAIAKFEPFTKDIICKDTIKLADQPLREAGMLKLVGNFVRFSAIEVLCEATVLSEKIGLPKETLARFVEAMTPGPSAGQLAMLHSGAYSDLTTSIAPISMALKENGYLNDLAQQSGARLRTLDTVTAHAERVNEMRGPDAKLLAIYGSIREENGLPFDRK